MLDFSDRTRTGISILTSAADFKRGFYITSYDHCANIPFFFVCQIDQNRDGFIDKEDLHDMLASLGKNPTDEYLEGMMNEAPGPINFTMFLTLFGERLQGI